jgi:transposase-like protein
MAWRAIVERKANKIGTYTLSVCSRALIEPDSDNVDAAIASLRSMWRTFVGASRNRSIAYCCLNCGQSQVKRLPGKSGERPSRNLLGVRFTKVAKRRAPGRHRPFTAEFRFEAVRLVLSTGRPNHVVAAELGIGSSTLGKRVAAANGGALRGCSRQDPRCFRGRLFRAAATWCDLRQRRSMGRQVARNDQLSRPRSQVSRFNAGFQPSGLMKSTPRTERRGVQQRKARFSL